MAEGHLPDPLYLLANYHIDLENVTVDLPDNESGGTTPYQPRHFLPVYAGRTRCTFNYSRRFEPKGLLRVSHADGQLVANSCQHQKLRRIRSGQTACSLRSSLV